MAISTISETRTMLQLSAYSSTTPQRASLALCFSSPSVPKNSGALAFVRVSEGNNINGGSRGGGLVTFASKDGSSRPIFDVLFEPFEEVKKEILLVPSAPHESLARQMYTYHCEKAINDQIK